MELDKKQVQNLANLAKLELSEKELELYKDQLKDVLVYVDKINELDLSGVKESLTGAEDSDLGPRPDQVEESKPDIIEQASQHKNNYVASPQVFDK